MRETLHIKNEMGQLARLYAFVDRWADACRLDESLSMQIKLALEEAVTNVILYAYPETAGQDIRIDMSHERGWVKITVTDGGIAFDPLARKDPDLTLPAEERPVGGLGIYLVKQLMTTVEYKRSDGKNILIMTKEIH